MPVNIQEHYFVFYRLKRATDYEKADLILDFDEMMKKWNINSGQTKKNWFLLELNDAGSYCKTGFLPASYKFIASSGGKVL